MNATQLQWDRITRILEANGLSLTEHRRAVLEYLSKQGPSTIPGLANVFGASGPHKVTLYRTVESLQRAGLVKAVRFPAEDSERYELGEAIAAHHHHVVCKNCGASKAVQAEPTTPRVRGFKVLGHQLEFYGLCRDCQHVTT